MASSPIVRWLVTLAVTLTSLVRCKPLSVVDLTHVLGEKDTVFWPGQPPFNFTVLVREQQPMGYWLELNAFGLGEHGGTHIDAPSHFAQGRWRMHQIPSSRLVGPGVVVDVEDKVKANVLYMLTVDDLKGWEEEHGGIPDGAVVMVHTGWESRYPDPKRVFNTDTPNDPSTFRFPGVQPEAARWLAEERNITALGVDFPGPNPVVHVELLKRDILILEYVANLRQLPPRGATIVIGNVKLRDGSGGPARILGLLGVDDVSGSGRLRASWLTVCVMLLFAAAKRLCVL